MVIGGKYEISYFREISLNFNEMLRNFAKISHLEILIHLTGKLKICFNTFIEKFYVC
jgi:hypothetical protein